MMNPKTLHNITRILILTLFVLLVGVLVYSLFYFKEINCNARLEFIKIKNCSQECKVNCINEGFSISSNHSFLGEKFYVSKEEDKVIRSNHCLCECRGCRE